MHREVYKISPIINNSFDKTSKVLVDFILSDFDVEEISYAKSLLPDGAQIGSILSDMHKPEYIYITFNYLSETSWTNYGGHQYCECILKNKSKILINWDISSSDHYNIDIDSKLPSISRKMKLKKLNNAK